MRKTKKSLGVLLIFLCLFLFWIVVNRANSKKFALGCKEVKVGDTLSSVELKLENFDKSFFEENSSHYVVFRKNKYSAYCLIEYEQSTKKILYSTFINDS